MTITRRKPGAMRSGLVALCAALLALALSASPALANRDYVSRITGFSNPWGLAVDGSDNLWVTDTGSALVSKYDPSGNLLAQSDGTGSFNGSPYVQDLAYGKTANLIYAADSNADDLWGLHPADASYSGTDLKPLGNTTCCYIFDAVDNSGTATDGDLYVTDGSQVIRIDSAGNPVKFTAGSNAGLNALNGNGTPGGSLNNQANGVAVDHSGKIYVVDSGQYTQIIDVFKPDGSYDSQLTGTPAPFGAVSSVAIDPSNGDILVLDSGQGVIDEFDSSGNFKFAINGADTPAHSLGSPQDLVVDSHGVLYVSDAANGVVDQFTSAAIRPAVTYGAVSSQGNASATLHATIDPNGGPGVTACHFEYGTDTSYGLGSVPCSPDPAASPPGSHFTSSTPVSADISGLTAGVTYHYRVVAANANGVKQGSDQTYTTQPPSVDGTASSNPSPTTGDLFARINPQGAETTYRFEYGPTTAYGASAPIPDADIGSAFGDQNVTVHLTNLTPNATYHFRVVATNPWGTTTSADQTLDSCPNALARQQTGAAQLLDCRAYELVSAPDAGGYNVESNLVPGQTPFGGYPQADSRVLYGVHGGGIPGTGHPTNHGIDPYLATRGANGWSTSYVGIPADNPYAGGPFASTLAEADPSLDTFAFGGPDICSHCFADGSAGTPLHMPDGSLVQGMVGSLDPGSSAAPAGYIGKHFSADGSHFVFGSEQQFESGGNPDNGNVTIYERDLKAAGTEVVSTDTGGTALADGSNVAELDVSSNGSRVVIGDLVHTDTAGNRYYHLYMHVAGNPDSIDLTPGTPDGALYDGMSADGTKVYFTTKDVPTGAADGDTSADIYRADVTGSAATLTRVSIDPSAAPGGIGDNNLCDPAANTIRAHWNTVGSSANCDAVAVGGGGGVASGDGSIYFLSPELLDGPSNGVDGAPNLYIARPGQAPHFIRTLESSANAPIPPAEHPFLRSYGALSNPEGVAIDHQTGSSYVLDNLTTTDLGTPGAFVEKFNSSGNVDTSFGTNGQVDGSDSPTGPFLEAGDGPDTLGSAYGAPTSVAVDNNPASPSYRDLYVPDMGNSAIDKFGPSGNYISQISVFFPTAVAVDQANGNVYALSYFGTAYVFDATGNPTAPTSFSAPGFTPTDIAVDSSGNSYITDGSQTEEFNSSGNDVKTLDSNPSYGVAVDPSNDHVYVDEGNQVVEFDSSGNQVGAATGSGLLSGSVGLGADSGNLDISNPGSGNVAAYGPGVVPPDPSTDNPLVIDSVSSAGTANTADFQVTPSGNDAVFTSTLPLTSYDNAAHREVFRYDAPTDHLDCASCNPTGAQAAGEATLASNGLSLTNDGRVFFNSTDPLVLRDLDNKQDVYEWKNGTVQLISTGTSPFDSSLLSVSADGTDAHFFTRDTLVPQDHNGELVKVYDARANGGFFVVPPPPPCAASDECHGAGTNPPSPQSIGSGSGSGGNVTPPAPAKTCKAGFVKKQGQCVRKPHHKKRRHHKRAASHRRGGAK